MSKGTHKDDDVFAWVVIGMVLGGVTLVLWGTLLWQSMHAGG